MDINSLWLLFYVGLSLIFLELIVGVDTGFDLLLIGLSLIFGAIGGFLFDSLLVALLISIAISLMYLFFGRKYLKQKLHISTRQTNIDALIDKQGIVTKSILPNRAGQVKVENEIWRATAEKTIKKDSKVKIISVEGVTLKVTSL